ncbi:MAG: NUDIX domain-containing protein [Phycisphaerae bacterium]|nr:NUDIX domain-containing protein [Phycisphaerae bacterium]
MARHSAGILVFRYKGGDVEVLLVHPGGPFWAKKDDHAWSIPKGEFSEDESAFDAAKREFFEETGVPVEGNGVDLGAAKQNSGKIVHIWAVEGGFDASAVKSNTFSMEWPPKSGKEQQFPEIDRAGWFRPETARQKLHKGQVVFIDRLLAQLGLSGV